jgi:hypothetical protein
LEKPVKSIDVLVAIVKFLETIKPIDHKDIVIVFLKSQRARPLLLLLLHHHPN